MSGELESTVEEYKLLVKENKIFLSFGSESFCHGFGIRDPRVRTCSVVDPCHFDLDLDPNPTLDPAPT